MPVTYTITNDDVASVSVSSKLRAGVRFDWTSQKVYIPSSVEQVTAQFIIDNCRFVEDLFVGSARPRIVVGAGAVQIGVDPDTASPISTPAIAIFDEEWKIVTEKTSGRFVVRDVYMNLDAATDIPYDNVAGVFIQYLTSVTGAVTTISSGSGLSPTQSAQLEELHDTLQAAGVFSTTALANAPSGSGGGGDSAATIYTYFTTDDRQEAFKTPIEDIAFGIWTPSIDNYNFEGTIASILARTGENIFTQDDRTALEAIKTKTDQLAFISGDLVATLNGEEVALSSASVSAIVSAVDGALTIPSVVQIRQELDSNSSKLEEIKTISISTKNAAIAGL